ncbi:hypothetical protein Malapachy_0297 [Malassezia pachydermatis]|uniref:Uncharacterized protein n=1 Tax=Malassezia pachydermatis TaxID=77020 RepID=A0A0M8MRQ0_9BASI|nr:hypothetical protein Malapachy_0297 [Malassezia pachydermatis]KOS12430.1 hypothetical protein Malapachy_0297 [Malassezia pachydermatis]
MQDWYQTGFNKLLTTQSNNIRNPTARMLMAESALIYFYHTKPGDETLVPPVLGQDGSPGINMNAR